jgi:hypothetical protein
MSEYRKKSYSGIVSFTVSPPPQSGIGITGSASSVQYRWSVVPSYGHEIVCQLRPLVYSLGLNNTPHISFNLVKSSVKNIRHFKQAVSRCKMAGAGFHSIAKLRAQIFNPVLADHGVKSVDCHNESGRTSDCQRQEFELESGLPQAWILHTVRIRSQSGSWQSAAVLPTGRNFGRKTQKWPHKNLSGRNNLRPNFWQIIIKMAEKWPNFFWSVLLT